MFSRSWRRDGYLDQSSLTVHFLSSFITVLNSGPLVLSGLLVLSIPLFCQGSYTKGLWIQSQSLLPPTPVQQTKLPDPVYEVGCYVITFKSEKV